MTKKILAALLALALLIWLLLGWATSNILYDWFVQFLKTRVGIDEPELIARYSGYVPALLVAGVAVYLAYTIGLRQGRGEVKPTENKDQWPRLTNGDRSALRKVLLNAPKADVYMIASQTTDCMRLAQDFNDFFKTLDWRTHDIGGTLGHIPPGIHIRTLPDVVNGANGPEHVGFKTKSGASALLDALNRTGFTANYVERGGGAEDYSVHMVIGVRPE